MRSGLSSTAFAGACSPHAMRERASALIPDCVRAAVLAALVSFAALPASAAAESLKIASPQRGSWEGAIPELGKQQGIFQKHGIDLDILYTAGGGQHLQA